MTIVMIGNPNVGKSLVLNRLTGSNFIVSNYAGTSLEISEAVLNLTNSKIRIIDTPGVYSVFTMGQDQQIIKDLLEKEKPELIINVLDATNLERNLLLSFELKELDIPMLMLVNQIDLARRKGLQIQRERLENIMGAPVVFFSAVTGEGLMELMQMLEKDTTEINHPSSIEPFFKQEKCGECAFQCSGCSIGSESCLSSEDFRRAEMSRYTAQLVVHKQSATQRYWMNKMEKLLDRPLAGTAILLVLVFLSFFILLKFIELSEGPIGALLYPLNLIIEKFVANLLPPGIVNNVLSKAIPEGLIIPFTIIMPAMLMVSLLMSVLEDTGLLPRYSVALERVGRLFGVSGQAVIPLSLGFGCRTPAIMATRLMPTMAERFIVITLLSIVIPCAATIGVMAAVISAFHASLLVLFITMLTVLMVLGFLISRLMPREEMFVYELPPLRVPGKSNVFKKVRMRFAGFFTEVLPLLLVMNIIIRALMESGFFELFHSMEGFTRALFGIPADAFVAVLVTMFQRYLAPLVLLNLNLTPREATIAIAMISLSLPCLPVMVMTVREIGAKGLVKILIMGIITSFLVGTGLNLILPG
ncbi:ferrous iron transport protein b [hydrocarbon metagenome]|uniref:Ferrous iron transport protein b n=1 Tax=hydrocarbon metagenome TaxID=938273 RepID=A0A0W8E8I6_9ZZZZ